MVLMGLYLVWGWWGGWVGVGSARDVCVCALACVQEWVILWRACGRARRCRRTSCPSPPTASLPTPTCSARGRRGRPGGRSGPPPAGWAPPHRGGSAQSSPAQGTHTHRRTHTHTHTHTQVNAGGVEEAPRAGGRGGPAAAQHCGAPAQWRLTLSSRCAMLSLLPVKKLSRQMTCRIRGAAVGGQGQGERAGGCEAAVGRAERPCLAPDSSAPSQPAPRPPRRARAHKHAAPAPTWSPRATR